MSNSDTWQTGLYMWRSRWAAIGAAVAVTFGAGGLLAAHAASPPSVFVPINPTRVLDTRIDAGLAGPLVSAAPRLLDVTGTVAVVNTGNLISTGSPVPDGATAIVANVTAVRATSAGFVSVRPGTASEVPATSNINISSGNAVPNSVTVELPTSGSEAGTVQLWYQGQSPSATTHLLVDIVGYYQVGPAGPQGEPGPAGPPGTPGVGFRTDCANDSMSVWNSTTAMWGCRLDLTARNTSNGYGARISSDLYRGMYARGASGWFDAYFDGNSGISTYGVVDRSGALRTLAVNLGTTAIEPGDLVAIVGVGKSSDDQPILGVASVDPTNADAVVGVAEREMSGDPLAVDSPASGLAVGEVEPGGYVVVITSGLAPAVNVDSLALVTNVPVGAKLALSADGEMVALATSSPGVEIGRMVGLPDLVDRTVSIYIDID